MPIAEDEAAVSRRINELAERLFELARPAELTEDKLAESLTALALAFISACGNQGKTLEEVHALIRHLWHLPTEAAPGGARTLQ